MRKGSFGIAAALTCASLFASFAAHAADTEAPQTIVTGVPAGNFMEGTQLADPGSLGTFTGTSTDGSDATNKIFKMRVVVTNPMGDRRSYESTNAHGWTFSDALPASSTSWRWVSPSNDSIDYWYSYESGFCVALPGEDPCDVTTVPDLFYSYPGSYKVSFNAVDLAGNHEIETSSNTVFVNVI